MAVGGFATLYRSLLESFKTLITSQDFGSEYELLCAELAIQSLRLHLWSESVGLDIGNTQNIHHSLLDRQDATPTIIQVLNSISFLLIELREIRQKYQPRATIEGYSEDDGKSSPALESFRNLPGVNPVSFRQRMRANQKQKSVVAIAKWTWRDARKLNGKVRRLKGLIDGLEDISRVARICSIPQVDSSNAIHTQQDENPPPYSPVGSRMIRGSPRVVTLPPVIARIAAPVSRFSDLSNSDLLEQHTVMKRYLAALPSCADHPVPQAREKLVNLSDQQLKELRIDAFDELLRRQQYETPARTIRWLPPVPSFHPKRNEARRKLSTLISSRFGHLVTDIVCELEHRFPHLQGHVSQTPPLPPPPDFPDPFITPRDPETRRWGCVRPNVSSASPPPFLQYRAAHQSTLIDADDVNAVTCSRGRIWESQPSRSTGRLDQEPTPDCNAISMPPPVDSVEIFKSFRVSSKDSTYKVLPAALKKYNIKAPWEQYALYVVYGDKERCLGIEEKPLLIFRKLDKEGKKPMFMLRKISSTSFEKKDFVPSPGGVV